MEYYCTSRSCGGKASNLIIYGCLESHIYEDLVCETCLQVAEKALNKVILTGTPRHLRCPECSQIFTDWLINKNWPPKTTQ